VRILGWSLYNLLWMSLATFVYAMTDSYWVTFGIGLAYWFLYEYIPACFPQLRPGPFRGLQPAPTAQPDALD
jgi:hypothetical protein